METTQLIQRNKEIAESNKAQCVYWLQTTKESTLSGNRETIFTTLYHAILMKGKPMNNVKIGSIQTDLVLKHKPTGRTEQYHESKLQGFLEKQGIKEIFKHDKN